MKNNLFIALKLTLVFALICCVLYPLLLCVVAQLAPGNGNGVTIPTPAGKQHLLVGQAFVADHYFWGRPSAVDYNAAGSGGSNKGPSNPAYLEQVAARMDTFLAHNPGTRKDDVPADLVTASGSGIDPHLSVQAARVQINRVASARRLRPEQLEKLIQQYTEKPLFGLFGPEKINVLKLNLALDQIN